jgi:hypothetical protein
MAFLSMPERWLGGFPLPFNISLYLSYTQLFPGFLSLQGQPLDPG